MASYRGDGDSSGPNYIYQENSATSDIDMVRDRGGVSVYVKKGSGNWMKRYDSANNVVNKIVEDPSFARPSVNPILLDLGNAGDIYWDVYPPFTFSDPTYSACTMTTAFLKYRMSYRGYFT